MLDVDLFGLHRQVGGDGVDARDAGGSGHTQLGELVDVGGHVGLAATRVSGVEQSADVDSDCLVIAQREGELGHGCPDCRLASVET